MASLTRNLIREKRICTTLPKARVLRSFAERIVSVARKGTLPARRLVLARLRDAVSVKLLLEEVLPALQGRQGGYIRITKLGRRPSDSSEMAIVEWVGIVAPDKRRKKKEEGKDGKDKGKPAK